MERKITERKPLRTMKISSFRQVKCDKYIIIQRENVNNFCKAHGYYITNKYILSVL
jgi:hypothetical protein